MDRQKLTKRFSAFENLNQLQIYMPDQQQRMPEQDAPWNKQQSSPSGDGPRSVNTPDTSSILKKLKRIESDQAKRYKQRSGE
jgi:hypothetical protein